MKAVDLGLSVYWGESPLTTPNKHYEEQLFVWGDYSYNLAHHHGPGEDDFDELVIGDFDELVNNGIITEDGYLSHQYDQAYKILGDKWRMPTVEELRELIDKCKWTWVDDGYAITGPSNNSIKLPYIFTKFHESPRGTIADVGSFWSSEPSYDHAVDGFVNEAHVLDISGPESNCCIYISSRNRNKKNLIIPVTTDRSFLKENDPTPIKSKVMKPWFMDMGDLGFEDESLTDILAPPIIPNGSYFPLPLWGKLSQAAKDYLIEVWGIDNENEYNKLLHDDESIAIVEHDLKCRGII